MVQAWYQITIDKPVLRKDGSQVKFVRALRRVHCVELWYEHLADEARDPTGDVLDGKTIRPEQIVRTYTAPETVDRDMALTACVAAKHNTRR